MKMLESMPDERLPEPLGSVVTQIAATEPDPNETQAVVEALKRHAPTESVVKRANAPATIRRRMLLVCPALAALAAAVLLIVTLGRLPTASALELLADALSVTPCIKMTSSYEGKTRESWIMPATRQSATRSDEWIEFFDANAETVVTHNRQTGELVRSVRHQTEFGFVGDLVSAIIAGGNGDAPQTIRGMEVISSKVQTIDGKKILTLELQPTSTRSVANNATATATITIDPVTDLPSQCVAKLTINGKVQTRRDVWSYPEEGPANIFALGVEPSTKLVDRVPSTDVKPLLAGVYSGRVKFDDYVAVTIQASQEVPLYFGPGDVTLAAKHGDKFLFARYADSRDTLQGKTRAEVAERILADPSQFSWDALTIVDGQTEYRFHSSGHTSVEINLPAEEFIVPSWHSIPHYAGRPPLGIGRGDVSSAIATEAEGAPEGCVFLQTLHGGAIPEAPADPEASKRIRRMLRGGYWIRADRDYLVMQQDSEFQGEQRVSFTLDTLAQSPRGFWYPTRATQPNYNVGENTISATHYSYHLDFQQKLPQKMFNPKYYPF
ncbi:MAG: hypothetical protein RIK87_06600 [Fuerstiella sp.]